MKQSIITVHSVVPYTHFLHTFQMQRCRPRNKQTRDTTFLLDFFPFFSASQMSLLAAMSTRISKPQNKISEGLCQHQNGGAYGGGSVCAAKHIAVCFSQRDHASGTDTVECTEFTNASTSHQFFFFILYTYNYMSNLMYIYIYI